MTKPVSTRHGLHITKVREGEMALCGERVLVATLTCGHGLVASPDLAPYLMFGAPTHCRPCVMGREP